MGGCCVYPPYSNSVSYGYGYPYYSYNYGVQPYGYRSYPYYGYRPYGNVGWVGGFSRGFGVGRYPGWVVVMVAADILGGVVAMVGTATVLVVADPMDGEEDMAATDLTRLLNALLTQNVSDWLTHTPSGCVLHLYFDPRVF